MAMVRRKPGPLGGMRFADGGSAQIVAAQCAHFNQIVDEAGWAQARTAARDYLLASIWWLAQVEGERPTYELLQVYADELITQALDRPGRYGETA
jgi:hypothetical protein